MHLEAKNMSTSYSLGREALTESRMEKDLEVLVDDRLSNDMQCQATVSKANNISMQKKRDKTIILTL